MIRRAVPVLALCAAALLARPAAAFRPFDSTDAAVAAEGELQLELGPVGWLHARGDDAIVAPDLVLNWGLPRDFELSLSARGLWTVDDANDDDPIVTGTALTLKRLLRRGGLQDATGPSAAVELSLLLPTLHDEGGVGASAVGVVSQRFENLTTHASVLVAWTRAEQVAVGAGLILEGPEWRDLRPVVEVVAVHENETATLVSGLAGVLWDVRPDLVLDLGLRFARDDGEHARELRAGFTWSFGSSAPWSRRTDANAP